ncbi:MAG: phosphoribosyl-AMP cyclohydrolase [bacterium]|jgi:phosphoribosyl-AMP cyclohydrolase
MKEIEEGRQLKLDFEKLKKASSCGKNLVPAVAQDIDSKEVLIIGYVSPEALDYSLENNVATFWSTSRNELWIKGKTSGDYLDLIEVRVNCEQNSLLYLVKLREVGACHTQNSDGSSRKSCYYRKITKNQLEFIPFLKKS